MQALKHRFAVLLAAALAAATAGCASHPGGEPPPSDRPADPPGSTLRAFASEAEMTEYLRALAEARTRYLARVRERSFSDLVPLAEPAPEAASASDAAESVTNVQHAGVDEGGIVKVHGEHLVILRRGRLFTVRIGDRALRPVSAVDAFGPEMDPAGAWYDELLVSGNVVVVIGYSYRRGGSEVGLFEIDRDGGLHYRSTWHLRSNDYYSSRNYASRLVGGKLVFYTPLYLPVGADDPYAGFPAIRRWRPGATDDEFRPIVPPTRVYRPERRPAPENPVALHTVTVCDLAGGELACEGTAVVGPAGRVFYVSPGSVYVWVTERAGMREEPAASRTASVLYRMPLDGSAPTALGVAGAPVDQFSFLESGDAHLNVLVRSEGPGEAMWGSEVAYGNVALLRVPLAAFGDGSDEAPRWTYRPLPRPAGHTFQNRFVGEYLLYGTGSGWGPPQAGGSAVYAVRWAGGDAQALPLPHGVDRIEAMGSDAVVVGTDGRDLHFTAVGLRDGARLAGRYTLQGASQGETRSHGFFYRPEAADVGVLGLPVRGAGRPGYEHLFHESASILFLRNRSLRFQELGALESRPEGSADDGCRASCVDWYGNARPLFLRGRIFALLGYELVEGAEEDGRIRELRRVSYAPRTVVTARE